MRLKIPGDIEGAIRTLGYLVSELADCRNPAPWSSQQQAYLLWWTDADARLRVLFADSGMADALHASQLQVCQTSRSAGAQELALREIAVWTERLNAAIGQLRALKPFVERQGSIIVLDTSALIQGVYFTDFDWRALAGPDAGPFARLIVPILVIEELDELKQQRDRRRDRARSVLTRLWELQRQSPAEPAMLPGRRDTIEVLLDDPWRVRYPVNDDEIIDRAVYVSQLTGRDVIIAARDHSMLYRAAAAGITAVRMPAPDD